MEENTASPPEIELPLFLLRQMSQTASHTDMLVQQGGSVATDRVRALQEPPAAVTRRRVLARAMHSTGSKATYARRSSPHVYEDIRNRDPDVKFLEKTVHLTRDDFDSLHFEAEAELSKAMDVRGEHGRVPRVPRKRRLSTREMLFMFLDIMGGSNEGGLGVERVAHKYSVSPGSVSNYFRHVLFGLYNSFDAVYPELIRRPSAEERAAAEGLVIGFPKCVFYVDGNKNERWRPKTNYEQERAYDGYKKAHAFSIVVFCDPFGRFIRLEISDKGAESDRNMYKNSEVYRNPAAFLSDGQHGMADMRFAGDEAFVVPFKRNESTAWMYRVLYNRYIRKQRMVNEWGIGYINDRFRLFLERWERRGQSHSLRSPTAPYAADFALAAPCAARTSVFQAVGVSCAVWHNNARTAVDLLSFNIQESRIHNQRHFR